MGKGVAYIRPFDVTLPLRHTEIELEKNKCCLEIHNSSDSMVEFASGKEIGNFDARSKGLYKQIMLNISQLINTYMIGLHPLL